MRIMKYDRGANERNAIGALQFLDQSLHWFRLDDGVMGGQSETTHSVVVTTNNNNEGLGEGVDGGTASTAAASAAAYLDFNGTINTEGGGFCSIRSNFNGGLSRGGIHNTNNCIRITFTGDGKTYKLLLSDGTRGFSTPSWQHDIPTTSSGTEEEIVDVCLNDLQASLGPRPAPSQLQFDPATIKEMGFMISLKLTDGSPNPVETFGEGIFPFSLKIHSIEYISGD